MKERKDQQKPDSTWLKSPYANLVRYRSTGTYYARFRVGGKLVWKSLKTDKITVAKMRLGDLEQKERKKASSKEQVKRGKLTVKQAVEIFRERGFRPANPKNRKQRQKLKARSIAYYEERLVALQKTWPDLFRLDIAKPSIADCRDWAQRCHKEGWSGSAFNHTLGLLREVFEIGIEVGARYDNPALRVSRETENYTQPNLMPAERFEDFVEAVANAGSGKSKPCAELIRFLAYGGFRKGEAAAIRWTDCDFEKGVIIVRGDEQTGLKGRQAGEFRTVPMIEEMRTMLERMREERTEEPETAFVMRVRECQKAMDTAAEKLNLPRPTHHALRHMFATRCIESGVDIPTVARWLGHKDGGALAMRTYGHLRDQHSVDMARRVSFATKQPDNVTPLPKEAHQ